MTVLHGLSAELIVDDQSYKGFRVQASITKTLDSKPNTGEIKVSNLARTTRRQLEQSQKHLVSLRVGYGDDLSQVFLGVTRRVYSEKNKGDIVTIFPAGDGEDAYQSARVEKSFGKNVDVEEVLKHVVDTLGIGRGNAIKALKGLVLENGIKQLSQGISMSGRSSDELTKLLRATGHEWSIQDGVLQILKRGKGLDREAFLLRYDTGLIGSPSVDNKGVARFSTLMIPQLFPGCPVILDSQFARGIFVIAKATYDIDTHGNQSSISHEAIDVRKVA